MPIGILARPCAGRLTILGRLRPGALEPGTCSISRSSTLPPCKHIFLCRPGDGILDRDETTSCAEPRGKPLPSWTDEPRGPTGLGNLPDTGGGEAGGAGGMLTPAPVGQGLETKGLKREKTLWALPDGPLSKVETGDCV